MYLLKLGKLAFKHFGVVEKGFDIISCQFALHYFFGSQHTAENLFQGLSSLLEEGGVIVATFPDAQKSKIAYKPIGSATFLNF